MLIRRLVTCIAALSAALAVAALALLLRGWLTSDVIKTYAWDPAARRYSELHVISQGGLLSVHHSGTTLAATADDAQARRRAGPGGRAYWHYRERASPRNESPWLNFASSHGAAHAGVANPNGKSDDWTMELQLLPAAGFFLALPIALAAVRWANARRRKRMVIAGQCVGCGYDLRASPDRCPECGLAPINRHAAAG